MLKSCVMFEPKKLIPRFPDATHRGPLSESIALGAKWALTNGCFFGRTPVTTGGPLKKDTPKSVLASRMLQEFP